MSQIPPRPKLSINCPPLCSFHPDKIGAEKADVLCALREGGAGTNVFTRQASEVLGRQVNESSALRHFKHYREVAPEEEQRLESGKVAGDLEILNDIIAAGHRNHRSWKPSIKDTLDAMRLKVQLTGNSAWEDMLAAMEAGLDMAEDEDGEEAEAEEAENPEAVLSPDERGEG